jgi:hypothetical protein
MTRLNARVVAALGVAVIVGVFVVMLLHSEQRRSGTDYTPNGAFVAFLAAGQEACQDAEPVPANTSAVRITMGTRGAPTPAVDLSWSGAHGEVVTSGGIGRGWREGIVTLPVKHVSRATEGTHVCARNEGPEQLALAGTQPDPGYHMDVAGGSIEARLRFDYLRPGRESWLQLLPTIAYRSTIAKSDLVRHWAWAGALLLMLLAAALALAIIVREEGS